MSTVFVMVRMVASHLYRVLKDLKNREKKSPSQFDITGFSERCIKVMLLEKGSGFSNANYIVYKHGCFGLLAMEANYK